MVVGVGVMVVGMSVVCGVLGMVGSIGRCISFVCTIVGPRIGTAIVSRSVLAGGLGSLVGSLVFTILVSGVEILVVTDLAVGGFCTIMAGSRLAGIGSGVVGTVGSILVSVGGSSIFAGVSYTISGVSMSVSVSVESVSVSTMMVSMSVVFGSSILSVSVSSSILGVVGTIAVFGVSGIVVALIVLICLVESVVVLVAIYSRASVFVSGVR